MNEVFFCFFLIFYLALLILLLAIFPSHHFLTDLFFFNRMTALLTARTAVSKIIIILNEVGQNLVNESDCISPFLPEKLCLPRADT